MATKTTKTTAKATTTKAAAKAPAKKTVAKKRDMKVKAIVEFQGKQVEQATIIADIKKVWTSAGNRIGDIQTLDIYIKPEESKAYYVINGTETGYVAF